MDQVRFEPKHPLLVQYDAGNLNRVERDRVSANSMRELCAALSRIRGPIRVVTLNLFEKESQEYPVRFTHRGAIEQVRTIHGATLFRVKNTNVFFVVSVEDQRKFFDKNPLILESVVFALNVLEFIEPEKLKSFEATLKRTTVRD